jgi:hypothetical protein
LRSPPRSQLGNVSGVELLPSSAKACAAQLLLDQATVAKRLKFSSRDEHRAIVETLQRLPFRGRKV